MNACVHQMEYPTYWTVSEFCEGFQKLLSHLHLDRVRLSIISLCMMILYLCLFYKCFDECCKL